MPRQTRLIFDRLTNVACHKRPSFYRKGPEPYRRRTPSLSLALFATWENEEVFKSHPRFPDRFILNRHIFEG